MSATKSRREWLTLLVVPCFPLCLSPLKQERERSHLRRLEISNSNGPTSSTTLVRMPTCIISPSCARSGVPPSTPPMVVPHLQTSLSHSVTHAALHVSR